VSNSQLLASSNRTKASDPGLRILGDPAGYLRGTPSFFAGQDAPFGFLGLLSSRSIVSLP
jgi:hypothetical protein